MNEFIWTDLSTYHLNESVEYYSNLFGWQFINQNNYYLGGVGGKPQIGIYETPEFFKKINMPHFWMNYIEVDHLDEIVVQAESLGGIIEIKNEPFYDGRIALIRDPMGAGFTVYEGKRLKFYSIDQNDMILSRELHTSRLKPQIQFYKELLNWKFDRITKDAVRISAPSGKFLGNILEIDNSIKGKYEYWVTEFLVNDLEQFKSKIKLLGGEIISDEQTRILVTDQFKEAFFYLSSSENSAL